MSKKLLFIPVSSPKGIGEYKRSLTLASQIKNRHSSWQVAFILNETAPYTDTCPFKTFTCPSSPTLHNELVNSYMDQFQPDIVIFDASGRVSQLKHAKQIEAYTIFICQHVKKFNKGLGLRRLKFTDEIWYVQPELMAPKLSFYQKLKLKVLNKSEPKIIGPIFPPPSKSLNILDKLELRNRPYIVFNAGSGGHNLQNTPVAQIFADALQATAEINNTFHYIMIYGPNYSGAKIDNSKYITALNELSSQDFVDLISQARVAVISGGSTLFQAVHFGTPSISISISNDQSFRIQECEKLNLTHHCQLIESDIVDTLKKLIESPKSFDSKLVPSGLNNALKDIESI